MARTKRALCLLELLLAELPAGNCEYCGDDFAKAQEVSRQTGKPIFEHDKRRGYFVVGPCDEAPYRWNHSRY